MTHSVRQLQHELATYLALMPALMWHIDAAFNEIVFTNDYKMPGLGNKVPLVLKDISLAKTLVHSDDLGAFYGAMDCVRALQPSTVAFRMGDEAGNWHWLFLKGQPVQNESFRYVGMIGACASLVGSIADRGAATMCPDCLELLDHPSLLVEYAGKKVAAANAAARRFFGYEVVTDFPSLDGIMEGVNGQYRLSIYEHLIFNAVWRGALALKDASGVRRKCDVQLRAGVREGSHALWMVIEPVSAAASTPMLSEGGCGNLCQALDKAHTEVQALQALLEHQPEGLNAEGVMLSHIYPSENRVEVTGVGEPFKGMEPHTCYPYIGSIAENIVQYALPHMVVEETIRSIRPIDWALFIPGGIHSYYAEPHYENDELAYVLIYCSTKSGAFGSGGHAACKDAVLQLADRLKRLGSD
ncbi:MAG: diguanylate cyclase [Halodesulfovibrio sp.]